MSYIPCACDITNYYMKRILGSTTSRLPSTTTVLGGILTKVQDPLSPVTECECGDFYIGGAGRIRMKKHNTACRLAAFDKSVLANHAWQDRHYINWEDAEILDTARDLHKRKTKEAMYIRMVLPGCWINRDEDRELSLLWLGTVNIVKLKDAVVPPTLCQLHSWVTDTLLPLVCGMHFQSHPLEMPPPEVWRPVPNFRYKPSTLETPQNISWAMPTMDGLFKNSLVCVCSHFALIMTGVWQLNLLAIYNSCCH